MLACGLRVNTAKTHMGAVVPAFCLGYGPIPDAKPTAGVILVPDIRAILETLKSNLSTGCLTVNSPWNGIARIYLLLGTVVSVTSVCTARTIALDQVLGWSDATADFDPNARPYEQEMNDPTGGRAALDPLERERRNRRLTTQIEWGLRAFALLALLFLVLPTLGAGLAAWWLWQSSGSDAAATAKYRAAPECGPGSSSQGCYRIQQGQLVSFTRLPGRCGRTDRLGIMLVDGQHETDIRFGCLTPYARYGDAAGQIEVKLFDGRITAVVDSNGQLLETVDSPAAGASLAKGLYIVTLVLLGPLVVLALFILVRHPGAIRDLWMLLVKGRLQDPQSRAA